MKKSIFEILDKAEEVMPERWEKKAIDRALKADESEKLTSFEDFKQEMEAEDSGKLSLRIAKCLHTELKQEAKEQGISLNQYISYVLASRPR